jgi:hypothetical protein
VTDKSYARALADMDAAIGNANLHQPAATPAISDRNELIELLQAQLDALRDLTDRD